ncbi:MAG TPA: hypothetical protein VFE62_21415 [Gemmataceae bacterium]|nr:hypothetical protein [Gemmataceae bacterium]
MEHVYWIVPSLVVLAGLTYFFWRQGRRLDPRVQLAGARVVFERDRSTLQAQFFATAAASGKPRGLRWTECQWNDLIEWVRDRQTGQLLALVGVTISFEAIEGGDMEGVAAVGNLRNASAVFAYDGGRWHTAGRAVFNLNPAEAVEHFKANYERIADEPRS